MQTLLFSATLPAWVKDITRRFLQPGHKLVDLVGSDKMQVGSCDTPFHKKHRPLATDLHSCRAW